MPRNLIPYNNKYFEAPKRMKQEIPNHQPKLYTAGDLAKAVAAERERCALIAESNAMAPRIWAKGMWVAPAAIQIAERICGNDVGEGMSDELIEAIDAYAVKIKAGEKDLSAALLAINEREKTHARS